jgi:hypothetical protein
MMLGVRLFSLALCACAQSMYVSGCLPQHKPALHCVALSSWFVCRALSCRLVFSLLRRESLTLLFCSGCTIWPLVVTQHPSKGSCSSCGLCVSLGTTYTVPCVDMATMHVHNMQHMSCATHAQPLCCTSKLPLSFWSVDSLAEPGTWTFDNV